MRREKCTVIKKYQVSLLSGIHFHFVYAMKHAHLEKYKSLEQQWYQLLHYRDPIHVFTYIFISNRTLFLFHF